MSNNTSLTLYGRSGCHLCDDMLADVRALCQEHHLDPDIDVIDIDSDPDLIKRYSKRIPVLCFRGEELCHYHLNPRRLLAAINPADG